MSEVRNLNKKRVGDMSNDKRTFVIQIKDCITRITANLDGTLSIVHEQASTSA